MLGTQLPSKSDEAPILATIKGLRDELSSDELKILRDRIRKYIVPKKSIDVSMVVENGETIFTTTYYGIYSRGELSVADEKSNCLKIYLQGHGGNPKSFDYFNQLRKKFLSDGCDVLSLSMLGRGFNEGSVSFPSRFGVVDLSLEQAKIHGNYSYFYDSEDENLDPLSLFLYPQLRLIEDVIERFNYDNVQMLGISGGGWYTVWLAAMLPKIDASLSYAGTLPMAYRKGTRMHGDWEQLYSDVYTEISYLILYQLMLADDDGERTRKSYLVYNDNDDCCFMDPSASNFKHLVSGLSFYPQIVIDRSDKHSMNVKLVNNLLSSE